jgi:hypothetical protein
MVSPWYIGRRALSAPKRARSRGRQPRLPRMTGISDGTAPRSLHLGDDLHLSCDAPLLHSFCETWIVFPLCPCIPNQNYTQCLPLHFVLLSVAYRSLPGRHASTAVDNSAPPHPGQRRFKTHTFSVLSEHLSESYVYCRVVEFEAKSNKYP